MWITIKLQQIICRSFVGNLFIYFCDRLLGCNQLDMNTHGFKVLQVELGPNKILNRYFILFSSKSYPKFNFHYSLIHYCESLFFINRQLDDRFMAIDSLSFQKYISPLLFLFFFLMLRVNENPYFLEASIFYWGTQKNIRKSLLMNFENSQSIIQIQMFFLELDMGVYDSQ